MPGSPAESLAHSHTSEAQAHGEGEAQAHGEAKAQAHGEAKARDRGEGEAQSHGKAVKLQKLMAEAGYGARRKCEQMIREGRVAVNGRRAKLGERALRGRDRVTVNGQPLRQPEPLTYLALHKPSGVLSSARSQGGHPTVLELVGSEVRLQPVGRLDLESEGLVLLTNDGELTHRLTHPRFGHEKEYRVQLDRLPDHEQLRRWRDGVRLPTGVYSGPSQVDVEPGRKQPWMRVILRQGKKRQIRETVRVLGLKVVRLIRIRIASLRLGELESGEWRVLRKSEIIELQSVSEAK